MLSTALDLTVRVGCHLTYDAAVPTPIVFMLRPHLDENHFLTAEKRSFEPGLPSHEFQDSHGNIACRSMLKQGRNDIRLDSLITVSSIIEEQGAGELPISVYELPSALLRYTLPSRYCDSDKLFSFAWEHFGHINNGYTRVQAICDWVHRNIEYRYGSGRPDLSASDLIERRYGVCRDFAHAVVALCRTFNLPARYVTGHLPDIGFLVSSHPEDFHAYAEVYLGGRWYTFDARFNVPRTGRIKLSHGLDAVDGAFATIYGDARLEYFEVWTYQVDPKTITLNDPIDLSKRLDGSSKVRLS
jgi:transglutaminase-like putative cysteine protease